jgi:hypothetical protein
MERSDVHQPYQPKAIGIVMLMKWSARRSRLNCWRNIGFVVDENKNLT